MRAFLARPSLAEHPSCCPRCDVDTTALPHPVLRLDATRSPRPPGAGAAGARPRRPGREPQAALGREVERAPLYGHAPQRGERRALRAGRRGPPTLPLHLAVGPRGRPTQRSFPPPPPTRPPCRD